MRRCRQPHIAGKQSRKDRGSSKYSHLVLHPTGERMHLYQRHSQSEISKFHTKIFFLNQTAAYAEMAAATAPDCKLYRHLRAVRLFCWAHKYSKLQPKAQ